ncbi:MAG: OadG family protein [Oscillospiraceae bacterium]|nr:OadG family protein [Oscillospiraceae bacterium]
MNTAFRLLSESETVIDRIQGLGTAENQLKDPDYWGSVGIITITGILVVFLILAILIIFFWLMGTIFKSIDKSRAAKKVAIKAETPAPAAAPVVEESPAEEEELDNDDEIVAVISAAIAAYEGDSGYTIKSISRYTDRRTRSAWSLAGIGKNMSQF